MEYIQVTEATIAYTHKGAGSPVILLHGWGCTHAIFSQIEKELIAQHKVYALDFPGFGSSAEPQSIWGVEEYTRALEEFIQLLQISDPILIGHSFGCRVSLLYASRNTLSKMILIGAAGIKPSHSLLYYWKVYSYKTCKYLAQHLLPAQQAEQLIESFRSKSGSKDYQQLSGRMRAIFVKIVNEDLCSIMPRIKASTLLLFGALDTATPISDGQKMEQLIPDAGLVVLKDCTHYCFLEEPFKTQAIINSFLK